METTNILDNRRFWLIIGLITIVHILGMIYIDIMAVDAAQYASISHEMLENGEFLQVQHREADYLDKPPLLFWVTATAYKLFGISNFTFRLPTFLFLILGIFSTFKLGEFYYNRRTGMLSALVLYSCQAYFLFSHDVRTDTILANVLVFGLWQLAIFMKDRTLLSMVLGSFGIGLAMLEKGPIGLMVAIWALGAQIAYKRDWSVIFLWEWLVGFLVLCITLAPMTWGLYQQFGWHGPEFFYWTQSFGRITGQSEWRDNSTIFYFLHTFLWAFLPWMFLAYYGVFKDIVILIKTKFSKSGLTEVLTLGGFIITFAALSLSNYKLPHYIFVVFPLVSIITASAILNIIDTGKGAKVFVVLQNVVFVALWLAVGLLCFITFPVTNPVIIIIGAIFFAASFYFLWVKRSLSNQLIYSALFTIIGVNFMLSTHFYPTLLEFQAGSIAGKMIVEEKIPEDAVYAYKTISHPLDFYSRRIVQLADKEFISSNPGIWVFTTETGKVELENANIEFSDVKEFKSYPVTLLSMEFLNPSTRSEAIDKDYLVRIQ